MTLRIGRAGLMLLLPFLPFLGCNDPVVGEDSAQGSYTLASVDGAPPPVVVVETPSETTEITGGALTLEGQGECTLRRDFRTVAGGATTTRSDSDDCNWTRAGIAIFLTLEDGGAVPGTWDEEEHTASFSIEGHTLLFAR